MCLDPWGRGDSGDYFQSAEYKAQKKAEAKAKKETQAKRLKTVESGGCADFSAALKKLKVPVLKKLCGANGLAVGGTKPQLLERIKALTPIEDPGGIFSAVLTLEDEHTLYQIVNEMMKRIGESMAEKS